MKHSMEQIFANLSIFLLLITFTVGVTTFLTLEQNNSYAKINNLKNQKTIIYNLTNLQRDDTELTFIQLNGRSTQLTYEIDKLQKLNNYDYTSKYIFDNSSEFLSNLNKLSELTTTFNGAAREFYEEDVDSKKLKEKNDALKKSFYSINAFIDVMIFKNISYIEEKFHLLEKVSIFSFTLLLFATFWYRKRLKSVADDIRFLFGVGKNKKDYDIFSVEADAIRLRMGRKQVVSENPDMIDQVTQINNYKGMMTSYNNKKGLKENFVRTVTVFEIDNFSKQNRAFPQEFTQAVLKKVAFTISLHEQATDVMARTDYNQFTVILSRSSQEQSFKDIDIIRQSISELKFKSPDGNTVIITISGGFVVKPSNKPLDDALRQAKDILIRARINGTDNVLQVRDIAHMDMP